MGLPTVNTQLPLIKRNLHSNFLMKFNQQGKRKNKSLLFIRQNQYDVHIRRPVVTRAHNEFTYLLSF